MDIFCFSLAAEASGRSFDATVAGLVRYVFQRTGSAAAGTHRESLPCFVSFGDVYRDSGGTATGVRLCYLQMGSYIRKLTSGEFRWGWGIGRQSYTYVNFWRVPMGMGNWEAVVYVRERPWCCSMGKREVPHFDFQIWTYPSITSVCRQQHIVLVFVTDGDSATNRQSSVTMPWIGRRKGHSHY
jgi:hypothetical protein